MVNFLIFRDIFLIFSAMSASGQYQFPLDVPEPRDYHQGVEQVDRVISRNALVYQRLTQESLQQKQLANRMHNRYVLLQVLETPGIVSLDGHSIHLAEGDALLVAPYQFHNFISIDQQHLRWVFITFELVKGGDRLRAASSQAFRPEQELQAQWVELTRLWVEQHERREEVLPMLDRLLMHLQRHFAMSSCRHKAASPSQYSSNSEWVSKVEALILRSTTERWTLQQVAEQAGLSERHMRTRFQEATGISPSEYRANYQLHQATSLMRDPGMSFSNIADLCGFDSSAVFTRFIKRMTGKTPTVLRNKTRQ